MIHVALRKKDGLSSGRPWLRSVVKDGKGWAMKPIHRMGFSGG